MNYVLSNGKQQDWLWKLKSTAKGGKALCFVDSVGHATVILNFETFIRFYMHAYV